MAYNFTEITGQVPDPDGARLREYYDADPPIDDIVPWEYDPYGLCGDPKNLPGAYVQQSVSVPLQQCGGTATFQGKGLYAHVLSAVSSSAGCIGLQARGEQGVPSVQPALPLLVGSKAAPSGNNVPLALDAAGFPMNIKEAGLGKLTWEVTPVGSPRRDFQGTGPHDLFFLAGQPQLPQKYPWARLLRTDASWLDGYHITDSNTMLDELARRLFSLGWRYNEPNGDQRFGQPDSFNLGQFLDELDQPPDPWPVNCFDTAHVLASMASALGIPVSYRQWGAINDESQKIATPNNSLILIGYDGHPTNQPLLWVPPQNPEDGLDCRPKEKWFGNHAWVKNELTGLVFDALFKVDADSQPDDVDGDESCGPFHSCRNQLPGNSFVRPVRMTEAFYRIEGWDICPLESGRTPFGPASIPFVTNPLGQ